MIAEFHNKVILKSISSIKPKGMLSYRSIQLDDFMCPNLIVFFVMVLTTDKTQAKGVAGTNMSKYRHIHIVTLAALLIMPSSAFALGGQGSPDRCTDSRS